MVYKGQQRWIEPPQDEIPGSVGIDLGLASSDNAVVYVVRPASYGDALVFDTIAVCRIDADKSVANQMFPADIPEGNPDDFLRLAIEFADGRRVSNVDDGEFDNPPEIALWQVSGQDGGGYYLYEWYLWPLPEEGDLVFVCEWPALGIPEHRTTMSGEAVRSAALRARNLWD